MTLYRLRTSPSGPIQEINVPDLPITSDDVTNQSNAPGATVTEALNSLVALPFPTVRYCAIGTPVPTLQQDGSPSRPFSSIQAACDSLAAATTPCALLLAPGDYRAQTGLTFAAAVPLQVSALEVVTRAWQSSSGPLIADFNYSGAADLKFNGIQHGDIDAGTASLSLENCSAGVASIGSAGGVISTFNCFFGASFMSALNIRLRSCEVRGLSATAQGELIEITNTEWTVGSVIAFSGAPGDARLDSMSEFYWNDLGGAGTLTNGTIVPLYLP